MNVVSDNAVTIEGFDDLVEGAGAYWVRPVVHVIGGGGCSMAEGTALEESGAAARASAAVHLARPGCWVEVESCDGGEFVVLTWWRRDGVAGVEL